MCEPATIAAIATVAGAAISAAGSIQQGQAESAAASYRAQVARNNQIIADRAAADATERGRIESNEARQSARLLQARQRAVIAGSGVDISSSTASSIFQDTARFGEVDAQRVEGNAAREAIGLTTQGLNFGAESQLADASGRQARTGSFFTAGSTLLSSVGTVANRWYQRPSSTGFSNTRGIGGGSVR